MRRWLFNLLAVLSLVLCVSCVVLWLCIFLLDGFRIGESDPGHDSLRFVPTDGGVRMVAYMSRPPSFGPVQHSPDTTSAEFMNWATPLMRDNARWTWWGLHFERHAYISFDSDKDPLTGRLPTGTMLWHVTACGTVHSVVIPVWFILAFLALTMVCPLLLGSQVHRRRWRTAQGLCPTCGYDLRASPERCPECGTVTTTGATA